MTERKDSELTVERLSAMLEILKPVLDDEELFNPTERFPKLDTVDYKKGITDFALEVSTDRKTMFEQFKKRFQQVEKATVSICCYNAVYDILELCKKTDLSVVTVEPGCSGPSIHVVFKAKSSYGRRFLANLYLHCYYGKFIKRRMWYDLGNTHGIKNITIIDPKEYLPINLYPQMKICESCSKIDSSMTCSGCEIARYCNSDCQKKHWRKHKKDCAKWKDSTFETIEV